MNLASLLDGVRDHGAALLGWIASRNIGALIAVAAVAAALTLGAAYRHRRRRAGMARAARLQWGVHDLKERLRVRLAEPQTPFAGAMDFAPTMGAREAFEADIEAAAKTVLVEAGGRRGKAKHILRERLANSHGKLNGSEATHWRQLGALSLLDSTGDALKAYARAAEVNPADPQAHLLLGVLSLRAGRLEAAEAAFRRHMELASGTGGEAARCRAGTMLGDVLAAKGEREAALAAYEAARREAATLMEREPNNAAWQRDLSIMHDRLGDMLLEDGYFDLALEHYRSSFAIAETLAKRDPANLGWQRDLSVAHDRVGEALDRKGDQDGALASFRAGLALAEAIAQREPERMEWRWDVSISQDRIGDILLAKGKAAEALAVYRRGLEIAQAAADVEPARTGWQRDLAVSYHKVGSLEALGGNEAEARELLERGRAIIARLDRIAAYGAQWRSDLAKFDQALGNLGP
jgi:predicted negative regulator of RcsB-dependent stress response